MSGSAWLAASVSPRSRIASNCAIEMAVHQTSLSFQHIALSVHFACARRRHEMRQDRPMRRQLLLHSDPRRRWLLWPGKRSVDARRLKKAACATYHPNSDGCDSRYLYSHK
jgi:hypothetical protein